MRDQDGPHRFEIDLRLLAPHPHRRLSNRQPGQILQPGIRNLEGEQRRCGFLSAMSEHLRQVGSKAVSRPSQSQQQFLATHSLTTAQPQLKSRLTQTSHLLESGGCSHHNARVTHPTHEAVNDALRTVGLRKHPPVLFDLQGHSTTFKPRHGLRRTPMMKRPDQLFRPTRIELHQRLRIKAGMRHVAATTAGNPHLAQHLTAFLQDQHPRPRHRLRECDRPKEPRRSAARDDEIVIERVWNCRLRHGPPNCGSHARPPTSNFQLTQGGIASLPSPQSHL